MVSFARCVCNHEEPKSSAWTNSFLVLSHRSSREFPLLLAYFGCPTVAIRPVARANVVSELDLAISQSGAEGIRTPDPLIANEVRYQLRYSPLVNLG